jgi:hypothetical protein
MLFSFPLFFEAFEVGPIGFKLSQFCLQVGEILA